MEEDGEDLDEYLTERIERQNGADGDQELDVYSQLAQSEKDLLIAAELGKALLEKNEELERLNSQLHEEFQTTFERMEQEKHEFRFRLENTERQYELIVKELQADILMYKNDLEARESTMKNEERERYMIVAELTKQNERLTEQLRKSEKSLEEMSSQANALREQIRSRQSSTQAQVAQQELLRDEISLLTENQSEAERRFGQIGEERDALSASLDDSHERYHILEIQNKEKEAQLRAKDQHILELKDSAVLLEERLEDVYLHVSSGDFASHNNSLFSELEMSSDGLDHFSRSSENLRLRPALSPRVSLHDLDDDDIECDDDVHMMTCASSCQDLDQLDSTHSSLDVRHEYIESYKLVRALCRKLKPPTSNLSSPTDECSTTEGEDTGGLLTLLQDLRECVDELHYKTQQQYDESFVRDLDDKIRCLSLDVSASRNQLECLRNVVHDKDGELKRGSKQMDELNRRLSLQKLTLQHQEMVRIQKERDDYSDSISTNDTSYLVDQARKERDSAIHRRNSMELELARIKLELTSTDRQLIEAIHQKISLSEQLEQCQMDFESVLDFQIQKRFNNEVHSPRRRSSLTHSPKKKFSFLS